MSLFHLVLTMNKFRNKSVKPEVPGEVRAGDSYFVVFSKWLGVFLMCEVSECMDRSGRGGVRGL